MKNCLTAALITTIAFLAAPTTASAAPTTTEFQIPMTAVATAVILIYPPPSPVLTARPFATTGDLPGVATISAGDTRVTVYWRNITSGAAGAIDLVGQPVSVSTGPGQVVATVTPSPGTATVTLITGFGTFPVP